MPSTTVKLCSSDARAWTHNQPVWLDDAGEVARPVTREEQFAISKALERSARIKQSFTTDLPLLSLNANGRKTMSAKRGVPVPRLECAFEITFVGEKRVVTIWHGTQRYATGREVLAARLLADHGECVLHGRNGKCIGVLRDPYLRQREPQAGPRVQYSRNPLDPRKHEAQRNQMTDEAGIYPQNQTKRKTQRAALARSQRPTYSPAQCPNDCRGIRGGSPWALAKTANPPSSDEHHPVCKFAAAWGATLEKVQTTEVLFDLETSEVKRPAMPNEIEEASLSEASTGIRQVTVAGRIYAVLTPADAEQAAREARGMDLDDTGEDLDDSDAEPGATLTPVRPASAPDPSDRSRWPSLDELSPGARLRPREQVTARDYLARRAGMESTEA